MALGVGRHGDDVSTPATALCAWSGGVSARQEAWDAWQVKARPAGVPGGEFGDSWGPRRPWTVSTGRQWRTARPQIQNREGRGS